MADAKDVFKKDALGVTHVASKLKPFIYFDILQIFIKHILLDKYFRKVFLHCETEPQQVSHRLAP